MPELLLVLRITLVVLLYGFLALALFVIARDFRERGQESPPPCPSATLTVEAAAPPEENYALRPVTAIGRSRDNHVIIDDRFASSNHAIVAWRDNTWWVEDLNSHNGTFLNDERVTKPRPLVSGDRIGIGETLIRFEIPAP